MRRSIVALVFGVMLVAAAPARAASITVGAPAFNAGDTFTVTVSVQDVTDLFTFGFELSFDDAVVSPIDASPAGFLDPSAFFFPIFPDEPVIGIAGTVQLFGSLVGAVPGVSGSGDLAFVRFLALASGDPMFALANIALFDSLGGTIEAEVPTTVPEPAALVLLAFGLAALRRRLGASG